MYVCLKLFIHWPNVPIKRKLSNQHQLNHEIISRSVKNRIKTPQYVLHLLISSKIIYKSNITNRCRGNNNCLLSHSTPHHSKAYKEHVRAMKFCNTTVSYIACRQQKGGFNTGRIIFHFFNVNLSSIFLCIS